MAPCPIELQWSREYGLPLAEFGPPTFELPTEYDAEEPLLEPEKSSYGWSWYYDIYVPPGAACQPGCVKAAKKHDGWRQPHKRRIRMAFKCTDGGSMAMAQPLTIALAASRLEVRSIGRLSFYRSISILILIPPMRGNLECII